MADVTDHSLEKCYRILELVPGAGPAEVKNAYLRLKKLFTEESPVLRALSAEFPAEKRSSILAEIEDAYRIVMASLSLPIERPRPAPDTAPAAASGGSGTMLKLRRENRGVSLRDIHSVTKIRVEILENIESEKFEALPDESFLRNHLAQYARLVGLDPKETVEQYLDRYAEWRRRRTRLEELDRKK